MKKSETKKTSPYRYRAAGMSKEVYTMLREHCKKKGLKIYAVVDAAVVAYLQSGKSNA